MDRHTLWGAFTNLLPVWFIAMDATQLSWASSTPLGIDATTYVRGSAAYVAGGNPWLGGVTDNGTTYHFAGLPPTVVAFVPFTILPEAISAFLWVALSALAAVIIVRRLQLAWWYLLFPPMLVSVWAGNPQLPLIALILVGGAALAPLLKIYALVPLVGEGRWRAVALALALVAATVLVAPSLWVSYLGEWSTLAARQVTEAHGGLSAWGLPLPFLAMTVAALGVLAVLDPRAAGWLAVPVLWPGSQLQYGTMALPVAGPLTLGLLAVQLPYLPALIPFGYAARALWRRWPYLRLRRRDGAVTHHVA